MDVPIWLLVAVWAALTLALCTACITAYLWTHPPRDTDVEQLADEVARLSRRSRADTMRRVRAEAAASAPSDLAEVEGPPQLKKSVEVSALSAKDQARKRLMGGNGGIR